MAKTTTVVGDGGVTPGLRLFKVGGIVYAVCARILAVLTYGLNTDLELPLTLLVLMPPFVFLGGLLMIPSTFIIGYVTGTSAISLTYALGAAKRNWRGVSGVLLLIGAGVSVLLAVLLGVRRVV